MIEYQIALINAANNLGMNPKDLDLYVYIESSRNPKWLTQKNSSGYGGILQWGNAASQDLGYKGIDDLLAQNRTFTKQFQVAEKWIRLLWSRHGKKSNEVAYLYLCHFLPYNAKKWGQWGAVLQGKTRSGKVFDIVEGTDTYNSNEGLDYDKDGKITVGDIRNIVAAKAKEIGLNVPQIPPKPTSTQSSTLTINPYIAQAAAKQKRTKWILIGSAAVAIIGIGSYLLYDYLNNDAHEYAI